MRQLLALLVFLGISAILFNNCGQGGIESSVPSSAQSPFNTPRRCFPGVGATGSPQTIEEAVGLINSLPMPVTVTCFLESLDRPLDIYGTNSTNSAQPSPNPQNPRVFIIRNNLYISIVTSGVAKDLVEFSQLQSTSTSTKAELEFPISAPQQLTAPFDRIRFGAGTTCGFCHTGEAPGPTPYSFVSKAVKPNIFAKIPVESIRQFYLTCNKTTEPERCEILRSVFGHGTVRAKEFPDSMPTL